MVQIFAFFADRLAAAKKKNCEILNERRNGDVIACERCAVRYGLRRGMAGIRGTGLVV